MGLLTGALKWMGKAAGKALTWGKNLSASRAAEEFMSRNAARAGGVGAKTRFAAGSAGEATKNKAWVEGMFGPPKSAAENAKNFPGAGAVSGLAKKRILGFIGAGLGFGALSSFFDDGSLVGGAAHGAATAGLYAAAGPGAISYDAMNIGGGIAAGIASPALGISYRQHIDEGMMQYHPTMYDAKFGGNLRRRALGHAISSRSSNRSFLGSEATEFHDGGY